MSGSPHCMPGARLLFAHSAGQQLSSDRVGDTNKGCICRRGATVEAVTQLTCLCLRRQVFVEILGPMEKYMAQQKNDELTKARLAKLTPDPKTRKKQPATVSWALLLAPGGWLVRPSSVCSFAKE
jgi:hypothetical protein